MMKTSDWLNATVNLVIGVFMGIALFSLGQLVSAGFWPIAVLLTVGLAIWFWFNGLLDRLMDKIFPSGIRAARKPSKPRSTPLPRKLSLPLGVVIGVVLALLGLSDRLLDLLY